MKIAIPRLAMLALIGGGIAVGAGFPLGVLAIVLGCLWLQDVEDDANGGAS